MMAKESDQNLLISTLCARVGYGASQAASVIARCDDKDLLEKVKQGDAQAISELISRAESKRVESQSEETD